MIYLNAGNLWEDKYLDAVIELNRTHDRVKVASLFGSIAHFTPTARAFDRIPYLQWGKTEEYIKKALANGIQIRYTLNQSCIGSIQDFRRDWLATYEDRVRLLHKAGVEEWTVTSALLIELIHGMYPDDFIEVSTIAEVSTVEDARRWANLGADGVNLSTSINRDFHVIKNILRDGMLTPSVLANEACLWKCPWRRDCYNLSSHNSERGEDLFGYYPFRRCTEVRLANPSEWIRSRLVLPQWMKFYQEHTGIQWFKVAFRTHPIAVALPILEMYMEEQWKGNLLELWPTITQLGHTDEPKDKTYISCKVLDEMNVIDFFTYTGRDCRTKTCDGCGYCASIYKDAAK